MLVILSNNIGRSQVNDSIVKPTATDLLLSQPNFSIYRDNYFVTGTTLKESPSTQNSDVKYQISIKHLLSRKPVFDNAYAFITYTQKSFWKVYKESSPFEDINFNPGIGLMRPYTSKKGRIGYYSVMLEHESNGRDSITSRSWNFVSLNWRTELNDRVFLKTKVLIPFAVADENSDLLDYVGFADVGMTYVLKKEKLYTDVLLKKGANWDWKGAVQVQLVYSPFKSANQYFMLQWYHGYGEGLLDYDKKTSFVRFGIIIKPNFMNFF
ncbi:MAG: phospholipase A [Zunongwangia sp.]|uniref:phospholipase A n=1 Tax=Zunongwangia sp. TaxID=1965325 RepID=UPI003241C8C1